MDENHNIENFFRKRLDSQEFHFRESDWLLLEKRLNTTGKGLTARSFPGGRTGLVLVIAAITVTLAFLLGWIARIFFEKENQGASQNVQLQHEIVANLEDKNHPPAADYPVKRDNQKLHHEPGDDHEMTVAERHVSPEDKISEPISIENLTSSEAKSTRSEILKKTNSNKKNRPASYNAVTGDSENGADISTEFENRLVSLDEMPEPLNINIEDHSNKLKMIENRVEPPDLLLHPNDQYLNRQPHTPGLSLSRGFLSRWWIGFSLAPDINSMALTDQKLLSLRIGGQIYFGILPRWSVSTGLFYNNKKYNGSSEYYAPPEGYWKNKTNGVIPDKIFGSCGVIDIPIMITYTYAQKNKFIFTVSAGASNYLMLNEYYNFKFIRDNPGATEEWQTTDNSTAPFSIANLSLGFEMYATQRIRFVVEPYIKVPLKQIGWGNVNLYGMGFQATLKYHLMKMQ